MDWNDSLLWLIGLSAAIFAFRVVSQRPWAWGWTLVLVLIGGTIAVGWFRFPAVVGYVALAEWCVLVLAPSVAQRTALRLVNSRRPNVARWIARVAVWLHPADGWDETRKFIDALALLQRGETAAGRERLAALRDQRTSLGRTAIAMQARQSADWAGILEWLEQQPDREELLQDVSLADVYLQSLGETGRRGEMLAEYHRLMSGDSHPTAQVRVAALCGDVAAVDALLRGPLHGWPAEIAEFWVATARQAAGDPGAAAAFARLTASDIGLISGLAARRLATPVAPMQADELNAAAQATLATLRSDVRHEIEFAVLSSTPYRRAIVTWLIAGLLTINFLRELAGGAEDEQNLVALGAIVIPATPDTSEWWRPFAAAFIHFGWAHFLMNLFGLLFLGARLERAWGWWKTAVCYLAAIVVSMTITPRLLEAASSEPQILAGASGGIMGLLGGLLGHLLIGRWRRRTPQVAQQLSMLISFVLLQSVFDLSHPEVSQQAHLLGLAAGCVCGLIFGWCSPQPAGETRTAAVVSGEVESDVVA
jgi:rhomboid protease GluP